MFLTPVRAIAQTIDVGPPDTSVCNGIPVTLTAELTGAGSGSATPATYTLSDDSHTGVVEIGFYFVFYGNTYTQCVISSNSYVTFDLTQATQYSPWSINAAAPNAGMTPNNKIMFPYQDTNPSTNPNGVVSSVTCGIAPNRRFVVTYDAIAMFSCTTLEFTNQLVLFETSNRIEMHIASKPLCPGWNGGAAIQGLENATGTVAHVVPGRNYPTQWTATNDSYEFVPDGNGGYDVNATPFDPEPVTTNNNILWYDDQGNNLGTTASITVSPTVSTWYYGEWDYPCNNEPAIDSILVTLGNVNITTVPSDASCFNFMDGSVEVDPVGSAYPVSLEIFDAVTLTLMQQVGGVNGTVSMGGLGAGNYVVTITDGVDCTTSLTFSIDHPTLLIPNAGHFDILCNGDDNGRAYAGPSGGVGPYQLAWSDPLSQTTDTIEFLAPGSYNLTVIDAQACVSDTTLTVIEPLPLLLDLTSGADTCLYKNGAVRAVMEGGTPLYGYKWDRLGGDSANYSVDAATTWSQISNLSHGDYSVVITDANGCQIEGASTVTLIIPPAASFTSRSKPEEFIDPNVRFDNESTAALTYEWHFGDGAVSYLEYPEHAYDTSGTFLVMLIAYNDLAYGCSDTTFRYMEVDPMFTFYVPSGFTPDGDGLNDGWGPVGQNFEYESYDVQIYDRWGSLIWRTDNPFKQWDGNYLKSGKEVTQGLYVYVFTLKEFNTFEPKVLKGTVTLYRHK